MDPIRSYPDYVAPATPEHPLLRSDEKRKASEIPGTRLFVTVEHFMSWVIKQNKSPEEQKNIVRNLESVLRICQINGGARFITSLEESHALGILKTLTEGLLNGNEHWNDILPATKLMLMQLTRNPKSRLIEQTVQLKYHFHDAMEQTDELSLELTQFTEFVISLITPGFSRERTEQLVQRIDQLLSTSWTHNDLHNLYEELHPPSDWLKG